MLARYKVAFNITRWGIKNNGNNDTRQPKEWKMPDGYSLVGQIQTAEKGY